MGRKLRVQSSLIGILIGLGCIAVLLRQVELKDSWHALGRLRGPFMLIPLAVFCLNLPLRAWRWRLIFPTAVRPRFVQCFSLIGIGNMANFLLPGRAGDIARCTLAGPGGSLFESSRALATLAVERIFDGVALISMVLFSIWALHPPGWVLGLLQMAVLIFSAALLALIFLRYKTRIFIEYIRRFFRRVHLSSLEEKFDGVLTAFADGLAAITSMQEVIVLMFLTALIWSTEASLVWGLAKALGIALTFKSAIVASAILGMGFMIPAAPGGLGTYELFGTEAFRMVGIEAGSALALTVVIHAWVFTSNVIAGLVLLALKGLSLSQLKQDLPVQTDLEPESIASSARPSLRT